MNDSNPWENQLRSWTPRGPSPKLKGRLFGVPVAEAGVAAADPAERARARDWNWLYPAVACVALVLAMTLLERAPLPEPARHGATNALFASLALSNHIISAVQTNFSGQDHNRWHVATFVSTKASQTLSSMGSLPVVNTNNLKLKQ